MKRLDRYAKLLTTMWLMALLAAVFITGCTKDDATTAEPASTTTGLDKKPNTPKGGLRAMVNLGLAGNHVIYHNLESQQPELHPFLGILESARSPLLP
jgi:hypothetical protein